MTEQFDPYRKWLGIPPKDQPPDHYRLLGIPVFEDDLDVIENSADRQMAHVRTYQSGRHAAASQKILNELSAAKLCLLDPKEKAAYDKVLKAKVSPEPLAAAAPPRAVPMEGPPAPAPVVAPQPGAQFLSVSAPQKPVQAAPTPAPGPAVAITGTPSGASASRGHSRRKQSPMPMLVIGGAAVALVLVLLGAVAFLGPSGDADEEASSTTTVDTDSTTPTFDSVLNDNLRDRSRRDGSRRPDRNGRKPYGGRPRPARDVPAVDEPVATDFDLPFPSTDDGGLSGLDPDYALTARNEQVEKSLTDFREALATRDFRTAQRHFDAADQSKDGTDHIDGVEQARVIGDYYQAFIRSAQRGAGSIKTDVEFQLGGKTVTMVFTKGDTITYYDGTAEQEVSLAELSQEDMLSLADRVYAPDDAMGKLHRAAFLAFDDQGDHDANLDDARRLWRSAANDGLRNEALGRELGIYGDVAANTPPSDGPTGLAPPPFDEAGLEASDNVPANDNASTGPARTPVPDAAALRTARAQVSRNFRAQLAAARLPTQKSAMAKAIFEAGLGEQDDDGYRYALLEKARDLAVDLGVPEALVGIVDEMAVDFDIDPIAEKATYLNKTLVAADSPVHNKQIFDYARKLSEEAIQKGQYESAASLAHAASRAARKAKAFAELKKSEEEALRVDRMVNDKQQADAAHETLANDPENASANEALGRYLCLYEEDWSNGLPHLAKASSDTKLKELAATELSQPQEAAEQTALAEAWLVLGEKTGGLTGDAMRRRALMRYRHIAPFLDGDEKTRVDERISELGPELEKMPEPEREPKARRDLQAERDAAFRRAAGQDVDAPAGEDGG